MATKKTTSTNAGKLKNYTSTASRSAIFDAIRKTLVAHKAKCIMFDFDETGRETGIDFVVPAGNDTLRFRLPARFDEAAPLVAQARKLGRQSALTGEALKDQAYRTVWATIRDWLDAQMALIDIGATTIQEVFLPYLVIDDVIGQTLFENFTEQRALPGPGRRVIITEE